MPEEVGTDKKSTPLNQPSSPKKPVNWKLVVIVLLLAAILGGGFWYATKNLNIFKSPDESSTDGLCRIQERTPIADKDTFSILYAHIKLDNTNNPVETKTFISDIAGKSKKEVDIGYFYSNNRTDPLREKGFTYATTRDGKYLIRKSRVGKSLEAASVKQSNQFHTLVELSDGNIFTYEQDGDNLVYSVRRGGAGKFKDSVHLINMDGTGQTLIKEVDKPISSLDFDSGDREIYFGAGNPPDSSLDGFKVLLNEDCSVKTTKKESGLIVNQPLFAFEAKKAYFRRPNKDYSNDEIIEYNLENKKERVIYGSSENFAINHLLVSPKGDILVFLEEEEPSLENSPITDVRKKVVKLITTADGKVQNLAESPKDMNLIPVSWSPNRKYVWFETVNCIQDDKCAYNEGNTYTMEMSTKSLNLFFEDKATGNQKEGIEFIGWMAD